MECSVTGRTPATAQATACRAACPRARGARRRAAHPAGTSASLAAMACCARRARAMEGASARNAAATPRSARLAPRASPCKCAWTEDARTAVWTACRAASGGRHASTARIAVPAGHVPVARRTRAAWRGFRVVRARRAMATTSPARPKMCVCSAAPRGVPAALAVFHAARAQRAAKVRRAAGSAAWSACRAEGQAKSVVPTGHAMRALARSPAASACDRSRRRSWTAEKAARGGER